MNQLNLMYMFSFSVPADDAKQGEQNAKPIVKQCEEFASGLGMLVMCNTPGAFDGYFHVRVVFNIKGSQDPVLSKVSALFAFAASAKLEFVNQEFLPK